MQLDPVRIIVFTVAAPMDAPGTSRRDRDLKLRDNFLYNRTMISAFANSMKVPELRHRILFTLAMIVVVRLGVQIPLPGIDVMELQR